MIRGLRHNPSCMPISSSYDRLLDCYVDTSNGECHKRRKDLRPLREKNESVEKPVGV